MHRPLAAVAFALLTATVMAADPIEQRQDLMDNMRNKAVKPLVGMTRGEVAFDAAAVVAALAVMQQVAEQAPGLFPPGSDSGHDTEASARIWEDPAGFETAMSNFATAVAEAQAAPAGSLEALQPQVRNIMGTCKGCHDDYRVEHD